MTVYCQMEIHYIGIFHFIYILSADGLRIKYLPEVSCTGLVSTWWIQSITWRCPDLKDTDLMNQWILWSIIWWHYWDVVEVFRVGEIWKRYGCVFGGRSILSAPSLFLPLLPRLLCMFSPLWCSSLSQETQGTRTKFTIVSGDPGDHHDVHHYLRRPRGPPWCSPLSQEMQWIMGWSF